MSFDLSVIRMGELDRKNHNPETGGFVMSKFLTRSCLKWIKPDSKFLTIGKIEKYGGFIMKHLILFVCALMILSSALSFSQVLNLKPCQTNTGYILNDLQFIDQQNGWAVGQGNTILKTTDNGNTWVKMREEGNTHLYAVSFHNLNIGWVGGEDGKIFKTTDGGQQWEKLSTGSNKWIYDITFINDKIGWAAGCAGIFKTTDGGISWTHQFEEPGLDIYSLCFVDLDYGWALGGGIFRYPCTVYVLSIGNTDGQ
jgi:hypothetical protein